MLEIILLYFLCGHIRKLAESKGEKTTQWIIFTIVAWIVCEIIGLVIGIALFGFNRQQIWGLMLFSVTCGFGGYLIIRAILEKMPGGNQNQPGG